MYLVVVLLGCVCLYSGVGNCIVYGQVCWAAYLSPSPHGQAVSSRLCIVWIPHVYRWKGLIISFLLHLESSETISYAQSHVAFCVAH